MSGTQSSWDDDDEVAYPGVSGDGGKTSDLDAFDVYMQTAPEYGDRGWDWEAVMQIIIDTTTLPASERHRAWRVAICTGGLMRFENDGRAVRLHAGH